VPGIIVIRAFLTPGEEVPHVCRMKFLPVATNRASRSDPDGSSGC